MKNVNQSFQQPDVMPPYSCFYPTCSPKPKDVSLYNHVKLERAACPHFRELLLYKLIRKLIYRFLFLYFCPNNFQSNNQLINCPVALVLHRWVTSPLSYFLLLNLFCFSLFPSSEAKPLCLKGFCKGSGTSVLPQEMNLFREQRRW